MSDSTTNALGDTQNPKDTWTILEKRFGTKQEGIQSTLTAKLQLASWDGTGSIHTHCDYMTNLRTQLTDAGMLLTDQAFFSYFVESLPATLNIFITMYEDPSYNINLLCDKFAKYEMRQKLHLAKTGKADAAAEGSIAMFSQQQKEKERKKKKKHDLSNVTCYGCGKKGHMKARCQEKKDEKGKGKEVDRAGEGSGESKGQAGTLYSAVAKTALIANTNTTNTYYIDSGASDHLVPSKGELHAYKEFASPVKIAAADNGKIYAYGTGSLQITSSVNGQEQHGTLEDVYYTPGVHAQLILPGKLEDQGWDVCFRKDGMVIRDQAGDVFADIDKINKVYPTRFWAVPPGNALAMWTNEHNEWTTPELVQHLQNVTMTATARGGNSIEATLMTWHR